MSKTLVGICTFGNLQFTKLLVEAIEKTSKNDVHPFIIVGKPDDNDTLDWVRKKGYAHKVHNENLGFPAAINDMYDHAWVRHDYDYLIVAGNDTIPYPYAIDSMIEVAETTDYEWVCSTQVDVRVLCDKYPEIKKYFTGVNYKLNSVDARPWDVFDEYGEEIKVVEAGITDLHNFTLYKKSVMEKLGYIDTNFYPAYYSDNDYARRAVNAVVNSCTVTNSKYFHFWSRTIHEETGGSNHQYFRANKWFYTLKWGGDFAKETVTVPFDGAKDQHFEGQTFKLSSSLKIEDRSQELETVRFWKKMGLTF